MRTSQGICKYLESRLAAGCRPCTFTTYECILRGFVGHMNPRNVVDITPQMVRSYLGIRRTEGLRPSSLGKDRQIILAWLRWLTDEECIPVQNWSRRVAPVEQDQRQARNLSADECRRLLDMAERMRHYSDLARMRDPAILYFLVDTGVRLGELLNLRVGDLDLGDRRARITAESKGRCERTVWFSEETAARLEDYLDVRGDNRSPFIWVTGKTLRPSRSFVLHIVKRTARRAGLGNMTVHALRHTAATLMLRNGMDAHYVQRVLGHRRITTTLSIYGHLTNEDVRRRYEQCSPIRGLREAE